MDGLAKRVENVVHSHEDLLSVKSTDGDWHENRKPVKPKSKRTFYVLPPNFEDFRAHHFEATIPPQIRLPMPISQAAAGDHVRQATKRGMGRVSNAHGGPSPSSANLTMEGKRQAQAAGDILRARTAPSRHRKVTMTPTDHTSHQNRWANYKQTDRSFGSIASANGPQSRVCFVKSKSDSIGPDDGSKPPKLTSEGTRQAQAAGDKLRSHHSRTPIRHTRPSRSGSLDGVSKNRWSSYSGPRVMRLDERPNIQIESKAQEEDKNAQTVNQSQQPSLLEVFEAELAKQSSDANGSAEFPDPEISAIPLPQPPLASSSESSTDSTSTRKEESSQQPKATPKGFKLINDHLHSLLISEESKELSQVVEHGVRAAAEGFDSLMRGLTGSLQGTLPEAQAACEADMQNVNATICDLRNFVSGLASGLGTSAALASNDRPASDERGATHVAQDTTTSNTSSSESSDEKNSVGSPEGTDTAPRVVDSPTCSSSPKLEQSPNSTDDPKSTALTREDQQEVRPLHLSDIPQTRRVFSKQTSTARHVDTTSGPRYHLPGPIHLPTHASRSPSSWYTGPRASPLGQSGYVDHLRRYYSSESVDQSPVNHDGSPPTAATRFPSLAQFEDQNFIRTPSFPALPSMEPLIPLQASSQSDPKAIVMEPPTRPAYIDLRQERPSEDSADARHLLMSNGIDPSLLSNNQITSFEKQDRQIQQESIAVYAQNLAANRRRSRMEDVVSTLRQQEQHANPRPACPDNDRYSDSQGDDHEKPNPNTHHENETIRLPEQIERPVSPMGFLPSSQSFEHFSPPKRLSSAARLAEPFDPLDAEPSARPHLMEGVRRNATVAGTDSRYNARRRRPYSEAFDGNGRLAWDSFIPDSSPPRQLGAISSRRQEMARRGRDKHLRRQDQLRRSATHHGSDQRLTSPFRSYVDEHQDASTVSQINTCVDQLRDLGFAGYEDDSVDRLLVYAQAAGGDLVEAIDMIDEEQKAWSQRR